LRFADRAITQALPLTGSAPVAGAHDLDGANPFDVAATKILFFLWRRACVTQLTFFLWQRSYLVDVRSAMVRPDATPNANPKENDHERE
jgi:hypothetical protein